MVRRMCSEIDPLELKCIDIDPLELKKKPLSLHHDPGHSYVYYGGVKKPMPRLLVDGPFFSKVAVSLVGSPLWNSKLKKLRSIIPGHRNRRAVMVEMARLEIVQETVTIIIDLARARVRRDPTKTETELRICVLGDDESYEKVLGKAYDAVFGEGLLLKKLKRCMVRGTEIVRQHLQKIFEDAIRQLTVAWDDSPAVVPI